MRFGGATLTVTRDLAERAVMVAGTGSEEQAGGQVKAAMDYVTSESRVERLTE